MPSTSFPASPAVAEVNGQPASGAVSAFPEVKILKSHEVLYGSAANKMMEYFNFTSEVLQFSTELPKRNAEMYVLTPVLAQGRVPAGHRTYTDNELADFLNNYRYFVASQCVAIRLTDGFYLVVMKNGRLHDKRSKVLPELCRILCCKIE